MKLISKAALAAVAGLSLTAMLVPQTGHAAVRHLYLAASDGMAHVPDGGNNGYPGSDTGWRKYYIRGFCDDTPSQTAQPGCANMPAPIIDVTQGDDVFIHLRNIGNADSAAAPDPHTIHLHGIYTTTQNDGFNETSWEVPIGTVGTYYFKAEKPGTYMYHCHVEASEHITMGMYGAMIIRPRRNTTNTVYGGWFNDRYDREYIIFLTDMDIDGHDFSQDPPGWTAAHNNVEFNFGTFTGDAWMVNGRAFPDVLLPMVDTAACNATPRTEDPTTHDFVGCNPAGSGPPTGFLTGANNLATYNPTVSARWGERVLMRMINMGYSEVPWHIHGEKFRAVGKDANPIGPFQQKKAYTLHIGSGETYDLIVRYTNRSKVGQYATNSMVTTNGSGGNDFASNWSLYGGTADPAMGDNNLDDQWSPMHIHNDYRVTNFGAYPGGQAAMIHITP